VSARWAQTQSLSETWRAQQLTNATAKLIIYRAFIGTNWMLRSIWRGAYTNYTLRRNTKNFSRGS